MDAVVPQSTCQHHATTTRHISPPFLLRNKKGKARPPMTTFVNTQTLKAEGSGCKATYVLLLVILSFGWQSAWRTTSMLLATMRPALIMAAVVADVSLSLTCTRSTNLAAPPFRRARLRRLPVALMMAVSATECTCARLVTASRRSSTMSSTLNVRLKSANT